MIFGKLRSPFICTHFFFKGHCGNVNFSKVPGNLLRVERQLLLSIHKSRKKMQDSMVWLGVQSCQTILAMMQQSSIA